KVREQEHEGNPLHEHEERCMLHNGSLVRWRGRNLALERASFLGIVRCVLGCWTPAGLETRDTADSEVCATLKRYGRAAPTRRDAPSVKDQSSGRIDFLASRRAPKRRSQSFDLKNRAPLAMGRCSDWTGFATAPAERRSRRW